jgi:hypothetical protein
MVMRAPWFADHAQDYRINTGNGVRCAQQFVCAGKLALQPLRFGLASLVFR